MDEEAEAEDAEIGISLDEPPSRHEDTPRKS
jgi:hypothetical protein